MTNRETVAAALSKIVTSSSSRTSLQPSDEQQTSISILQSATATATATVAVDANMNQSSSSHRLVMAGFIAGTTVLGTLALIIPFVFTKSSLPYMATPSNKIRKALEFVIKQHYCNKSSATCNNNKNINNNDLIFVDMGSGDGETIYQAIQLGFKKAIGIELNYTLVLLSRLRQKLFWTKQQQKQSIFLYQDMLSNTSATTSSSSNTHHHHHHHVDYYLSSCHACMIFGIQPLMETLSRKLARTCQPGTHVLSYRFSLPTATKEQPDLLNADIVYQEQEMRIYKIISCPQKDVVKQQQQQITKKLLKDYKKETETPK